MTSVSAAPSLSNSAKRHAAGFDIGGTKCAVVLGEFPEPGAVRILAKRRFETAEVEGEPLKCLARLCSLLKELLAECSVPHVALRGVGISCGGPLDARRGVVLCPPNLPGWIDVPAADFVGRRTGLPTHLENDANACAVAEWKFGAGRGTEDMVFLTFGTGMGAGIISGGRLLQGASGLGGECGHIRIRPDGPVGFGKPGSFEGFCSGGGLGRQGRALAAERLAAGRPVAWGQTPDDIGRITARSLAIAARACDPDALAVYETCGERLGEGIAYLVDILNPERIVIGSVFVRAEDLLRPSMERAMARECIPGSLAVCRVVPAALGESIGDVAALAAAP